MDVLGTQQQTRPVMLGLLADVVFYPVALLIAEAVILAGYPVIGTLAHAAIFILLIVHSSAVGSDRLAHLFTALTLVPLIRLLSLLIPLSIYPQDYWQAIIGVPLFAAAILAARAIGLTLQDVGLDRLSVATMLKQAAIVLFGGVMALAQYVTLRPASLLPDASPARLILFSVMLIIFTGILEEMIFRGVIQRAAVGALGGWGIPYTALVSVILLIDYQSAPLLILAFVTALVFGIWASRTRSILGVSLAHGLLNVLMFVVFPLVLSTSLSAAGVR